MKLTKTPMLRVLSTFQRVRLGVRAALGVRAEIEGIVKEYAEHQSWRCADQDRYPWDEPSHGSQKEPNCACGLLADLRHAGLPQEWGYPVHLEGDKEIPRFARIIEVRRGGCQ